MGTKDKQTPSRCWERCSSPRRMPARLPATPAPLALTLRARGAGGDRGRVGSNVPSCSSPITGVHPGAVAPPQPCAPVSSPRQPPRGQTVPSAGDAVWCRAHGVPPGVRVGDASPLRLPSLLASGSGDKQPRGPGAPLAP